MNAIIISVTSDISVALIRSLRSQGYNIFGTFFSTQPDYSIIKKENTLKLDIKNFDSNIFKEWIKSIGSWDLFISSVGTLNPVGFIENLNSEEWVNGVNNNSLFQIGALINCLPYRNKNTISTALFFAGGGTNSATTAYSAYTVGKISLIKTVELIDHEIKDLKVTIIGPGWVDTKIHKDTLEAKEKAGENYKKTIEMINNPDKMNNMDKLVKDINFLIKAPKSLVGGRNFSSVHDKLTIKNLTSLKRKCQSFYTLRRNFN